MTLKQLNLQSVKGSDKAVRRRRGSSEEEVKRSRLAVSLIHSRTLQEYSGIILVLIFISVCFINILLFWFIFSFYPLFVIVLLPGILFSVLTAR